MRTRKEHFSEAEVWYFVKVSCQAYLALQKEDILYCFGRSSLVVTPEGKLKLFWAVVKDYNMHIPSVKAHFGKVVEAAYYSPEELQALDDK